MHITHLYEKNYKPICTNTGPIPWPNPKTGKPITQYHLSSRSLPTLTNLHKEWYYWNDLNKKLIKKVPLNIESTLTPLGLAHWIQGDGYWADNTIYLCTDNFTYEEVNLLIKALKNQFGLIASLNKRVQQNKVVCWRIRFSSKFNNINNLINLVKPFFEPSLLYKLNITPD